MIRCFASVIAIALLGMVAFKNADRTNPFVNVLFSRGAQALTPSDKKDDLELIRQRILADLLEKPVDKSQVSQLLKTFRADSTWPGINYADLSRTGFEHRIHLENMLELATAFRQKGSGFTNDPTVKSTVSNALDFWLNHDFICENWWWNEMGTPGHMVNIMLLMDGDLTESQRTRAARIANRANLSGFGARPGGDLIVIAGMLGKQALFARNVDTLERVVKVMAEQITVNQVRGINPDMGFHHRVDNVTSIHTYGTSYANSFAYWAVKIGGTSYKFPDQAMKLLIDYYLDGICKSMAFGMYADIGARNRDLTREGALAPVGPEIAENLAKASDYRKAELQDIARIRRHEKKSTLTSSRFYWYSEYFAQQRPDYFASVRMFSSRNHNMEEPHNEEGIRNHHFADGSNFLTRTGREYYNIFPVWDWFKIPGATIVQSPELPPMKEIAKKGLTDFVGGVTDGNYGAAAFDFASVHDPLKARKSWFFFDNAYLCLGAGIRSEAAYPVATTLNQCLLNKDVVVSTAAGATKQTRGTHDLKAVSWVLHDSVAYIFPKPVDVHMQNDEATGSWKRISHQASASDETIKKEVFKLWIDHGLRPVDASYSYIVVPNLSLQGVDKAVKDEGISVLQNTREIQAAFNIRMGLAQIAFYKPGSVQVTDRLAFAAAQSCLVMIQLKGGQVSGLTVSDPTHKLTSAVFELAGKLPVGSGSSWRAVYDQASGKSTLTVDLPTAGAAGSSLVIRL